MSQIIPFTKQFNFQMDDCKDYEMFGDLGVWRLDGRGNFIRFSQWLSLNRIVSFNIFPIDLWDFPSKISFSKSRLHETISLLGIHNWVIPPTIPTVIPQNWWWYKKWIKCCCGQLLLLILFIIFAFCHSHHTNFSRYKLFFPVNSDVLCYSPFSR